MRPSIGMRRRNGNLYSRRQSLTMQPSIQQPGDEYFESDWLVEAVCRQASKDFKDAIRGYIRTDGKEMYVSQLRELNHFFLSDWFHLLTNLEGEDILSRLYMSYGLKPETMMHV